MQAVRHPPAGSPPFVAATARSRYALRSAPNPILQEPAPFYGADSWSGLRSQGVVDARSVRAARGAKEASYCEPPAAASRASMARAPESELAIE